MLPRYLVPGREHRRQRVGQFVFAARGLLQPRGELEEHRLEQVDARVIPSRLPLLQPALRQKFSELRHTGLLHELLQTKVRFKEEQPALGHILAPRHRHEAGELPFAPALEHVRVSLRLHQDVAVSQEERLAARELLRQLRGLARAVLHHLPHVADARAKLRAISEESLHRLRVPARHDAKLPDAHAQQPLDDVLEDGLALHFEHGLGDFVGEVTHARAFAGGEDDSFHCGQEIRSWAGRDLNPPA